MGFLKRRVLRAKKSGRCNTLLRLKDMIKVISTRVILKAVLMIFGFSQAGNGNLWGPKCCVFPIWLVKMGQRSCQGTRYKSHFVCNFCWCCESMYFPSAAIV